MKKIRKAIPEKMDLDEERRIISNFSSSLNKIADRIEEELDAESELFMKKQNRGVITIFGHQISNEDFTRLLILRDEAGISDRAVIAGLGSYYFKNELAKTVEFIKIAPGIRFPEVPDILKKLV